MPERKSKKRRKSKGKDAEAPDAPGWKTRDRQDLPDEGGFPDVLAPDPNFECPFCKKTLYGSCAHTLFCYDGTNGEYLSIDPGFRSVLEVWALEKRDAANDNDSNPAFPLPTPKEFWADFNDVYYFEDTDSGMMYGAFNVFGICSDETRRKFALKAKKLD